MRAKPLSFHVPDHSGQHKHHGDQGGDYEDDLKDCAPDGKLASGMVGPSPFSSGVPGRKVCLKPPIFAQVYTFPSARPFLGPHSLKKTENLTC